MSAAGVYSCIHSGSFNGFFVAGCFPYLSKFFREPSKANTSRNAIC